MNTAQHRQPMELKVSRELWESLNRHQQQEQHARFAVKVAPNYAPAHDLDTPIELAMVPRGVAA